MGHRSRTKPGPKMTGLGDVLSSSRMRDSMVPAGELMAGQQNVTQSPE